MGGETREGWIPWIGRQYNDFKSMLPNVPKSIYNPNPPPPPPPLLGPGPVGPPMSWGEGIQNLKNEGQRIGGIATKLYRGYQEAAKDPVRSNIKSGIDFYKNLWNKYGEGAVDTGQK